jgi:hypothetical protein
VARDRTARVIPRAASAVAHRVLVDVTGEKHMRTVTISTALATAFVLAARIVVADPRDAPINGSNLPGRQGGGADGFLRLPDRTGQRRLRPGHARHQRLRSIRGRRAGDAPSGNTARQTARVADHAERCRGGTR